MLSFSAVLLAGGQSSRMGCDKALLPAPDTDCLLWQRQWRILEELHPEKIIWSGPRREGMPDDCTIALDTVEQAGPLAGICASLDILRSDFLVVLAVDLPYMTTAFLQNFLTQCSVECGVVGQHGDFFEPLAAIYPRRIGPLAKKHLQEGRYALQELVREAVKQHILQPIPLDDNDLMLFRNWNSPADIKSP